MNSGPSRETPYAVRRSLRPITCGFDWLMWFLPFSVRVTPGGIVTHNYELWFEHFVQKLLEGDRQMLKLLRHNPFPAQPPKFIRARFFRYCYTNWQERRKTGAWWTRTWIDEYLPPVSLADANAVRLR